MDNNSELNQDQKQKFNIIKKTLKLAEKSIQDTLKMIDELVEGKVAVQKTKKVSKELEKKAKELTISGEERIIEENSSNTLLID